MAMTYTYWKDGDMFLGYMNEYPDYWTQGHTLDELRRMLVSLRSDIESDPEMRGNHREQGVLEYA